MSHRTSHKRINVIHTNLLAIGLSVLFCLTVLVTAEYMVSARTQPIQAATEPVSLVTKGSVKTGILSQDPRKRQEELNQMVEEGMLAFSVSATPFMKNGTSTVSLLVENPPGDGKQFTITIQRNGTEETTYQSDYLDPKQYINDVPLDVAFPREEYPCTAHFDVYRIEDNIYVGRAETKTKLYVLE